MDPLVTIYDEIEELEHIGVAAVNLYSQSQIVNYRLIIIKNTNDFETGICTWITRPPINHTWPIFKLHCAKGSPRDDDAVVHIPSCKHSGFPSTVGGKKRAVQRPASI